MVLTRLHARAEYNARLALEAAERADASKAPASRSTSSSAHQDSTHRLNMHMPFTQQILAPIIRGQPVAQIQRTAAAVVEECGAAASSSTHKLASLGATGTDKSKVNNMHVAI